MTDTQIIPITLQVSTRLADFALDTSRAPPEPSQPPPDRPGSATLSRALAGLSDALEGGEDIPLARIVGALKERGFGMLVFFMAFPMALPVPKPPGLTALLGLPLLLLTAQMAIGRESVWIPERIGRHTVSRVRLARLTAALMPWLIKVERIARPRMPQMTRGLFAKLAGLAGVIMSTAIFLPFPGFNTVPALSLCLIGLGDVMRDGLAVLIGSLLGVLWITVLGLLVAFVGMEGFALARGWLVSLL